MKEQIYTIPVIDGFKEKGECPFCNMYQKLDDEAVEYMLGASYMTDEIRMETNKIGFCKEHLKKMYLKQNRLGVALMLHTHLQKINADLAGMSENFIPNKKSIFKKNPELNSISSYLNNITDSCYICNRIENTFSRYIDTFFYMWKNKPEIKDFVRESSGFCIEHYSLLLSAGENKLNGKDYKEFCDMIIPIQNKNMKRLEDEIQWFINKFDYKYQNEPWKTSKDALPRALTKISSIYTEEEGND